MLVNKKDLEKNKELNKKNKKKKIINNEYDNLKAINDGDDIDQILERKRTLSK